MSLTFAMVTILGGAASPSFFWVGCLLLLCAASFFGWCCVVGPLSLSLSVCLRVLVCFCVVCVVVWCVCFVRWLWLWCGCGVDVVWLCYVCGVVCVCGVCVARLGTQKKPPCVDSKTSPCLPAPRAHVLPLRAWCRYTRGRFESTHGGFFGRKHRGDREERRERGERGGGSPSVLLTKKSPRRVLTWPHRFT